MHHTETSPLKNHPTLEATIGIEIHVQLKTHSKIFCNCPNQFGDTPNRNICHICTGYPGTLPVLNKKVVDYAIMAGLATHCEIAKVSEFSRKHYSYPDLPKNFQITQGDKPICYEGYVTIELPDKKEKRIRIMRIHMEEDAGKNTHQMSGTSLVDLNRTGTPLLEIVSHPDITSVFEAKSYLHHLRSIVQYLGVSDANMEKGSFRADINLSVKKKDSETLGTRAEMKNINSFKFIGQAIEYEFARQTQAIENGETIKQETRLWNEKKQISVPMRSKEEAQDYRYFTEPDLPLIVVDSSWIERLSKKIPELPHQKYHRFIEEYELSSYDAELLISKRAIAQFFEETVKLCKKPKIACNWILRDVLALLKEEKIEIDESKLSPEIVAELVTLLTQNVINSKVAQTVFARMVKTGKYPSVIIDEEDLKQIGSSEELEKIVLTIIENNPKIVESYKAGKTKVFGFFVGTGMKETQGKADPKILQELFKKHLG